MALAILAAFADLAPVVPFLTQRIGHAKILHGDAGRCRDRCSRGRCSRGKYIRALVLRQAATCGSQQNRQHQPRQNRATIQTHVPNSRHPVTAALLAYRANPCYRMPMLEGLPPNNAAHRMQLICPEDKARDIANLVVEMFDMSEAASSAFELEPHTRNWKTGDWIVECYFAYAPDEDMIRNLVTSIGGVDLATKVEFSTIGESEWLENATAGLDPVDAGRFIVHTSRDRKSARARRNRIAIEIDAALAFGTGHHGTTRGCLLMLDAILKQRRPLNILDVGTGTGVLAIAAAKVLHQPIACGDIDPISVETTLENAALNGVSPWIKPVTAPGLEHPALRSKRPYDLIFANILAKPLRGLAPSIARASMLETEIVLSGLLAMDVPGVLSAYGAQGFSLVKRINLEGWATLLMRNGGTKSRRFDERHVLPGWNESL